MILLTELIQMMLFNPESNPERKIQEFHLFKISNKYTHKTKQLIAARD